MTNVSVRVQRQESWHRCCFHFLHSKACQKSCGLSLQGLSVGFSSWLQAPFVHPDFLISPTQLTVWLRLYTCLRTKMILGTFPGPGDNTSTALSRACIINDMGSKTFMGEDAKKSHDLVGVNILSHRTKGDICFLLEWNSENETREFVRERQAACWAAATWILM